MAVPYRLLRRLGEAETRIKKVYREKGVEVLGTEEFEHKGAGPFSRITPETYFTVRNASEAVISPDGRYVAFLVGEWAQNETKQRTRLWLAPTDGGEAYPLTTETRSTGRQE
jgi:hypothetical protein